MAIGAQYAKSKGYNRICILDWDVHHGNGTENIFKEDEDSLFISFHRHQLPTE